MNLTETTKMAFAISLHKKLEGYNAVKYEYNIPKHMNKSLKLFFESNKFSLNYYTRFDETGLKLRIIYNYFIKNSQILEKTSDSEFDLFSQQLLEYKNEFNLFLNNYQITTVQELYKLFITSKIPFYIFYYVLKYVKFKESFLSSELIKNKLISVCKLMIFFNHFDEEYIERKMIDLQKSIDLN